MIFSARAEARQKSTHIPAGQRQRHQKAAVSIGFYSAHPKPAKQVLSKLDAEMRFETHPRIFRSWRDVISDLCFRRGFLTIFPKHAKQVFSKLDAEMRFETPPPYFQIVKGSNV